MKFYELAVGARFEFRGSAFRKIAMSIAEVLADGHLAEAHVPEGLKPGWGMIFRGETEVVSDGPLLAVDVAAKWRI